jgi:hypothetical protein
MRVKYVARRCMPGDAARLDDSRGWCPTLGIARRLRPPRSRTGVCAQAIGVRRNVHAGVWETLTQDIAQRGFTAASIRVLTSAGDPQSGKALTLLGASRPSGANCFILARGRTLGASICRLAKPVTVFTARDQFYEQGAAGKRHSVTATDAIGLVRRDVASVVMSWKISGRPNLQGLPLFEVSGVRAFGFGFRGTFGALLVRDAHWKTVSRLDLASR